MENLKFTKATIKDLDLVYEFMLNQADDERKYLNDIDKKKRKDLFYTKSEIKNILLSPNSHMLIAKIGNTPIGCGLAKIERASKWNKYAKQGYLGMLYIKKSYRKKGIAQKLQEARINWLKSKGINFITSWVLYNNKPAIHLIMKRGFKPRLIQFYKELK